MPKDLDMIGAITGTDKSSANHNYLVHYDRLFREHANRSFNFLEIGIFRGASLAMWRQYFDRATIIGIDIQEQCRQYATPEIIVEIGSQVDPDFLASLTNRYPPFIVIDDGSHLADHVIFTFEALFPVLSPGGIYVVEDLHFHAAAIAKHNRGQGTVNPLDYFLALSRTVMSNEPDQTAWGWAGLWRDVDEVTFFGHAAAIRKKAPRSCDVEAMNRIAEETGTGEGWERAGQYFAGNKEYVAAIAAYKRAVEFKKSARINCRISELQVLIGERGAAMDTILTALSDPGTEGEQAECLEHLGNLLVAERRFDEAIQRFRETLALAIHPIVRERIEDKTRRFEPPK